MWWWCDEDAASLRTTVLGVGFFSGDFSVLFFFFSFSDFFLQFCAWIASGGGCGSFCVF
jgi:hypothetical protein